MKTPTIILAAATLALPATAIAKTEEVRSFTVEYKDLNLASEQGVARLDQRIDIAAKRVCDYDRHDVGTRIKSAAKETCYRAARDNATRQFAAVVEQYARGG